MWERVSLTMPAVDRYLREWEATSEQGEYLVGRWRAVQYSNVTSWFLHRGRFDEYEMLRVFLNHSTIRADLQELGLPDDLREVSSAFSQQSALGLDGILAAILYSGGSMHGYAGSAKAAKEIAAQAAAELTNERYADFRVDYSSDAWAPWFCDIAWDSTILLTDYASAEITLICLTDTD